MNEATKLVERLTELDPAEGYSLLHDHFDGNDLLIEAFLDEQIEAEKHTLSEAEQLANFGVVFLTIGENLAPTKEARAAQTQREYFKELYFAKGQKQEALEKFYASRPDIAELDGVILN